MGVHASAPSAPAKLVSLVTKVREQEGLTLPPQTVLRRFSVYTVLTVTAQSEHRKMGGGSK